MNMKVVIKHTHKHSYFRKNSNSVFSKTEIPYSLAILSLGLDTSEIRNFMIFKMCLCVSFGLEVSSINSFFLPLTLVMVFRGLCHLSYLTRVTERICRSFMQVIIWQISVLPSGRVVMETVTHKVDPKCCGVLVFHMFMKF